MILFGAMPYPSNSKTGPEKGSGFANILSMAALKMSMEI